MSDRLDRELSEIIGLLKYFTSMVWTGYTAFFTVNTLLATGYGFISFNRGLLDGVAEIFLLLIAIVGLYMSYAAILVIRSIDIVLERLIERGQEISSHVESQIVPILKSSHGKGMTKGTTTGSVFFGALWVAAFAFAAGELSSSRLING